MTQEAEREKSCRIGPAHGPHGPGDPRTSPFPARFESPPDDYCFRTASQHSLTARLQHVWRSCFRTASQHSLTARLQHVRRSCFRPASCASSTRVALLFQDCFPARFGAIHFVNQPWYVEAVFKVMKPFIKDKTRDKVGASGGGTPRQSALRHSATRQSATRGNAPRQSASKERVCPEWVHPYRVQPEADAPREDAPWEGAPRSWGIRGECSQGRCSSCLGASRVVALRECTQNAPRVPQSASVEGEYGELEVGSSRVGYIQGQYNQRLCPGLGASWVSALRGRYSHRWVHTEVVARVHSDESFIQVKTCNNVGVPL